MERTLLSAPVQPAAGLGPDEVILERRGTDRPAGGAGGTEEEAVHTGGDACARPPGDLLAVPSLARRLHRPADEDILGIFELIGLDRLIARQQSLEDAVRREHERRPLLASQPWPSPNRRRRPKIS